MDQMPSFLDIESFSGNKFKIVKAILEKAYDIHSHNTKGVTDIKSIFDKNGSAKFSLDKDDKNKLVLDISIDLGVSRDEVLEAYKYIVDQATHKSRFDRNLAIATIYSRKRLMRKAIMIMKQMILISYHKNNLRKRQNQKVKEDQPNHAQSNVENLISSQREKQKSVRTNKSHSIIKKPKNELSQKSFSRDKKRINKFINKVDKILEKSKTPSKDREKHPVAKLYPECFNTWKSQAQTQDIRAHEKDEFLSKWYQAYCFRENTLLRKSLYILKKYKEEMHKEQQLIQNVQDNTAYYLMRKTFYTWIKKYQYRVNRRPLLMSALIFWGNKTTEKAFKSLKLYTEESRNKRKDLRRFWCIKSMITMIDHSAVYDKVIYKSQAFTCPISSYNAKELEITVEVYEKELLKKLYTHWKMHYFKIRNLKAKIAFTYVQDTFVGWRQYAILKKDYKAKENHIKSKIESKTLMTTFCGYKAYIKQRVTLKNLLSNYTQSKQQLVKKSSLKIWISELNKKLEYDNNCEIADRHYNA